MDLKSTFTEKIGPLPAYAWGLVGVGGVLLVRHFLASKSSTGTSATPSDVPVDSVNDASAYPDLLSGGSASTASTTASTYQPPAIDTNITWSQRALNYLIAQGVNPTDANTAVSAYFNGTTDTLNDTQRAAIALAETNLGAPPEGIPLPIVGGTITATQTTTPPAATVTPVVSPAYYPAVTPGYLTPEPGISYITGPATTESAGRLDQQLNPAIRHN